MIGFTRLPGGHWGIRLTGDDTRHTTGDEVDVTKRGGTTCHQRLGALISSDTRSAIHEKDPAHDCGRRWA